MSLSSHNNNQSFDAGAIPVRTVFGTVPTSPTYRAINVDVVPAATPTDVIVLVGSATKTIMITKFEITPTANANGSLDFYVYKRTTADTGGTSTATTITRNDSSNPAPTAVAKLYSANPSALGTGSLIDATRVTLASKSPNGVAIQMWSESFGTGNQQPLILRGVGESLAINLGGQTMPTGIEIYFTLEWVEL
jgi:hypothetical protein